MAQHFHIGEGDCFPSIVGESRLGWATGRRKVSRKTKRVLVLLLLSIRHSLDMRERDWFNLIEFSVIIIPGLHDHK